jgi:MYXO-CTERM domain-containing protein
LNREAQVADPHFVDAQLPVIALALLVGHRTRRRLG